MFLWWKAKLQKVNPQQQGTTGILQNLQKSREMLQPEKEPILCVHGWHPAPASWIQRSSTTSSHQFGKTMLRCYCDTITDLPSNFKMGLHSLEGPLNATYLDQSNDFQHLRPKATKTLLEFGTLYCAAAWTLIHVFMITHHLKIYARLAKGYHKHQ